MLDQYEVLCKECGAKLLELDISISVSSPSNPENYQPGVFQAVANLNVIPCMSEVELIRSVKEIKIGVCENCLEREKKAAISTAVKEAQEEIDADIEDFRSDLSSAKELMKIAEESVAAQRSILNELSSTFSLEVKEISNQLNERVFNLIAAQRKVDEAFEKYKKRIGEQVEGLSQNGE